MRQPAFTLKCMIIAFVCGMLLMAGVGHIVSSGDGQQAQAANIRDKRIVSVLIERDDTIWKIAEKYYTEECGTMREYVAEIIKCNSLENDTIYPGFSLIVPVWVSEEEAIQMQKSL